MRKSMIMIQLFFFIGIMTLNHARAAEQPDVKVLDIESNSVILEKESSALFDREVQKAIKGIKNITIQASPLPKKGYLIKVPLTNSIKVKNKWFDDFISEALLVYNLEDKTQHRLILYNDENTPVFFDIFFEFTTLSKELNLEMNGE